MSLPIVAVESRLTVLFDSCPVTAPGDDLSAELYDICIEETARSGMEQYEVSNFAIPGQECLHNVNYWSLGDYIGIGPGAASRVSIDSHSIPLQIRAAGMCTKAPEKWKRQVLENGFSSDFEMLSPKDSLLELLLTGIRTRKGISIHTMERILGLEMGSKFSFEGGRHPLGSVLNFKALADFTSSGHLVVNSEFIAATTKGMMISDQILKEIIL